MGFDAGRVRAVLFDIDGTLRDTDDEIIATILGMVPRRAAGPGTERAVRRMVLHGETLVQHVLSLADRFDLDGPINRLVARCAPGGHGATLLTPHAAAVLRILARRYRLGVVSVGPEVTVRNVLREHRLDHLVEVVVSGQTCRRTKPHPDPVLAALARLGVPAAAGVMVGDIPIDIRAGRAAGVQTVGVLTGFGTRRELEAAGPDLLVADLREFAEHLIVGAATG